MTMVSRPIVLVRHFIDPNSPEVERARRREEEIRHGGRYGLAVAWTAKARGRAVQ